MSTTVADVFTKVRALLDEYTDDGTVLPDSEVVDLQKKSIVFIDMAQKELYRIGKYFDEFVITNKPPDNLLGQDFGVEEHTSADQYYPNEAGVAGGQAYYFEVDDVATVTIEEFQSGGWTTIETVTSAVTEMTAYSGRLTLVASTNLVRMKFAGSTYYNHKNRALFEYAYSSDAKVPVYKPYFQVSTPDDFQTADQIVQIDSGYDYKPNYRIERNKYIYLPWDFDGSLRVVYNPVPATLTATTDTMSVDDITASAISYYAAARLAPFENQSLVNYFEEKFNELKYEIQRDFKAPEEYMTDAYS